MVKLEKSIVGDNMKMQSLECPNCHAPLEIENGLDTFFCKYCGSKIILEKQSNATIKAKVKMKRMEHEENLKDKEYAQERYKMEFRQKDERRSFLLVMGCFGIIILFGLVAMGLMRMSVIKQDNKLQSIVDEIMIDIKNEEYDVAYIKANSLYWDGDLSSENETKWDSIRYAIIEQIEEAKAKKAIEEGEINDPGSNDENESNEASSGFWHWFDSIRSK
ncbi:MAG: hypothetical protein ACI4PD_03060 [Butyricicoccus sp.]